MSWTDERVELLRKLWTQGLSASQIATELNHGITRNAVIGKVHRLGLSGRAKTPSTPSSRPRKVTRAPSHPLTHTGGSRASSGGSFSSVGASSGGGSVRGNLALAASAETMLSPVIDYDVQPFEDVVVPMSERISIMELRETTCRWPFGDPSSADFRFCGGNSPVGTPYCSFHARIAYQPSSDRRRAKPRD
jgi:GcrA cell cycle regulator